MPKWLPAITSVLPMALPLSTGKATFNTRIFNTLRNVFFFCFFLALTVTLADSVYRVCHTSVQTLYFSLLPLFKLGEGAFIPLLLQLDVIGRSDWKRHYSRGCVDAPCVFTIQVQMREWNITQEVQSHSWLKGVQTPKHHIGVYNIIMPPCPRGDISFCIPNSCK